MARSCLHCVLNGKVMFTLHAEWQGRVYIAYETARSCLHCAEWQGHVYIACGMVRSCVHCVLNDKVMFTLHAERQGHVYIAC